MALLPRDFLGGFANGEEGLRNERLYSGYGLQLARLRSDHMVDFRYDSGSFSHGRRDALGGACPHIADGEDTGPAGLKR